MEPKNHLQEGSEALKILFQQAGINGGALFLQTLFFLFLDPYLSENIRYIFSIAILTNAIFNKPDQTQWPPKPKSLAYWFSTATLLYLGSGVFNGSAGPVYATAQMWILNHVVPLLWTMITAAESDAMVIGESILVFVPLLCIGFGALCFRYFTAAVALLWFLATHSVLWLVSAGAMGLALLWKHIFTPRMRLNVTTQIFPRIKRKVLRYFSMVILGVLFLPSRALTHLEKLVVAWRDRDIVSRLAYKYDMLQEGHIRLLKVSRRTPFSGLRCRIIHIPLLEAPPYEAVSYCWGTDPATKLLVIDGKAMHVLDSVWDVLHHRYSIRQERLLWIDSVCINQKDDIEKGQQIQLMRVIFTRATGVLAWLGDMEHPNFARSFIFTLGAQVGLFGKSAEALMDFYSTSNDIGWKYLSIFLSKPWFTNLELRGVYSSRLNASCLPRSILEFSTAFHEQRRINNNRSNSMIKKPNVPLITRIYTHSPKILVWETILSKKGAHHVSCSIFIQNEESDSYLKHQH